MRGRPLAAGAGLCCRRLAATAAAVAPYGGAGFPAATVAAVRAAVEAAGATPQRPLPIHSPNVAAALRAAFAAAPAPDVAAAAGDGLAELLARLPPGAVTVVGEHVAPTSSDRRAALAAAATAASGGAGGADFGDASDAPAGLGDCAAVLRALAAVPDAGAPLASVSALATRPAAYLAQFGDLLSLRPSPPPSNLSSVSSEAKGPFVVPVRTDASPFVRALRRAVHVAPVDGIDVDALAAAVTATLIAEGAAPHDPTTATTTTTATNQTCEPAAFGFPQLTDALRLVADCHFIASGGARVVPLLWAGPMRAAAARCPPEGVLTHGFLRLLYAAEPRFRGGSLPGLATPQWVAAHFGDIWHVSLARTDGQTPIFRPRRLTAGLAPRAAPASGWSGFAFDVLAALRAGGGAAVDSATASETQPWTPPPAVAPFVSSGDGTDATLAPAPRRAVGASPFVDLAALAPYLRPGGPAAYGAASYVRLASLSRQFLDFDVRIVAREAPGAPRVAVFVDATTVSAAKATPAALAAALGLPPHAVLRRTVVRPATAAPHGSGDVVCAAFLEPVHVVAALLALLPSDAVAAAAGMTGVVVVCGAAEAAAYEALAAEGDPIGALSCGGRLRVVVV